MRKIMFMALAGLSAGTSAFGQDSLRTTTLDEVVVSATRTEQPVMEVPRSVTVISAESIAQSSHLTVGGLLNEHAGLFITGVQQTPGTNQNVFMRGTGSNQVAVLIDGVRITDPTSPNAAVDLSEISLLDVARIEIIRGGHSTMYGGAAVGGVINVVTRKQPPPGLGAEVAWQGGVFDEGGLTSTENVQLRYGFGSGFYVSASLFRQDARGLDATPDTPDAPSFTRDRDHFRKTDGALTAGFRNDRWDVRLSFRKAHQYTDIDDGAYADDDNYYLTFDRDLYHYRASYALSPSLRLSVLGSFSRSERFYEDDSTQIAEGLYDKTYASGTYYGKLQTHEFQLNYDTKKFHGVAGGGFYRETMNFDNYIFYNDPQFPFEQRTNYDTIDAKTTTAYAFARAQYRWGAFTMAGGGRYTNHTTADGFFTYELNPSYTWRDLLFYASVSTAFNPPSLYQLFDPSKGFTAFATRGNRALKPEKSVSLEAGIKKAFASGSHVTVAVYRTDIRDGIEYVYLWNAEKDVDALDYTDDRGDRYINVAEQRMAGVEVEGTVRFSASTAFRGNVTYVRTAVRARHDDVMEAHTGAHRVQLYNIGVFLDDAIEQEQLVRRPDFTSFAQLEHAIVEALRVYANYRYTGARYDAGYDPSLGPYGALRRLDVDAFHLFDIGATWRASEKLTATLRVENIFNTNFREVAGFRTRGRGVYAGLKLSL